MEELKEMLEKLSDTMSEMKEVVEVSEKYPDEDVYKKLLDKRIEDGIIENLHNASEKQLERMKKWYWKYYKEDKMFSHLPDEKVSNKIDETIIKKKREKKFERILR